MLPTVPAWNLPTVNTQECVGSLSLAINSCNARCTCAPIFIGSTPA